MDRHGVPPDMALRDAIARRRNEPQNDLQLGPLAAVTPGGAGF
jgi:hypothetical protein